MENWQDRITGAWVFTVLLATASGLFAYFGLKGDDAPMVVLAAIVGFAASAALGIATVATGVKWGVAAARASSPKKA